MTTLLRQLGRALRHADAPGKSDSDLLRAFVVRGDGDAFAVLVRRHGPMVRGVGRRLLPNRHDAEDAYQATFLVLARRAACVRPPEAVGGWLYGVAYRTALAARAKAARRRAHERQVPELPDPEAPQPGPWRELVPLLDREVVRLPEKYRLPVVLCELEGRPRREVARELGLAEGTLSSRLASARGMLARRLARHGPALGAAAVAVLLSEGAPAAGPAPRVVVAGPGAVPGRAAALAGEVVRAMRMSKLRKGVLLLVAAGAAAFGGVAWGHRAPAEKPTAAQEAGPEKSAGPAPAAAGGTKVQVRVDCVFYTGDPLGCREDGTLKVLAEPSLVTLEGRPAQFMLGREEAVKDKTGTIVLRETIDPEGLRFTVNVLRHEGGKFRTETLVERTTPGSRGRDFEEFQTLRTRRVGTVPAGQWVKLRCGRTADGKEVWGEVKVTEYK